MDLLNFLYIFSIADVLIRFVFAFFFFFKQKTAYEIHAERVRKSHLPSPVERVDVVKDPDRQISTALDAGIDVGEVNVPAIHADRRFPSPDLNEETGQQPERGADHEERAHRRQ